MSMSLKFFQGMCQALAVVNNLPLPLASEYMGLIGDHPQIAADGTVGVRKDGKEIARVKMPCRRQSP